LTWKIEWDERAVKEFKKLNKNTQKEIKSYLIERVLSSDDPRNFGKPLQGNLSGLWRYRISDHRIVCRITDSTLKILVLRVAHRSKVYQRTK
jgi:mRNA interferase RelE/StbE